MKQPLPPNLDPDCEVASVRSGYNTDEQSVINSSRKDHFTLVFDLPCGLKEDIARNDRLCRNNNLERLEYNVWGTVIPDISITNTEIPFGGQSFEFSSYGRPAYGAISCNFTVDNRYDNYYLLWKWINLQNDAKSGYHTGHIKDYSTTISIFPLDENKRPVAEFIYSDAFVTSLGSITKSTRDASETESTFSFHFSQLDMRPV